MIKNDIQLLFEYDRWPSNRVFQANNAVVRVAGVLAVAVLGIGMLKVLVPA